MPAYMKAIPLIFAGVLLNAFAQIAMKKAVGTAGLEWGMVSLTRLFLHPWMLACLACYAVSVVVWAGALKIAPLNFAFPFMALGFVCVALMAKFYLGEAIPKMRWAALAVIVIGVCLLAFSGETRHEETEAPGVAANADGRDDLENME